MPSTLVETVGAANANTYVTLAEANTYFGDRLHSTAWDAASDSEKTQALIMGARVLDTRVEWKGAKSSQTQAMDWPRAYVEDRDFKTVPPSVVVMFDNEAIVYLDSATVPNFIKWAQCEQALALLGEDITLDADSTGINSVSIGSLAVNFDKLDKRRVLPQPVRDLCAPYGTFVDQGGAGRTAKLLRA